MKKITLILYVFTLIISLQSTAQTTAIPNEAFETELIRLGLDSGPLDNVVLTANISGVDLLFIDGLGISDLTGIEDFTALIDLSCQGNNLTSLDLSNNTALKTLQCQNNPNLLTIDLQNGNNAAITLLNTNGCTSLICIQVDDVNFASGEFANKPIYEDCTLTSVPDDDFENQLINSGYDPGPLDNFVITSNISGITALAFGDGPFVEQVEDFTGIEDFTALTSLNFTKYAFSSIDLSNVPTLTSLVLNDNQALTSLNLSNNIALNTLSLKYILATPNLGSIDLVTNTALTSIDIDGSILTNLYLSTNIALTSLDLSNNEVLTSLDLSNNIALSTLNYNNAATGGGLTSLDLSTNTALTSLDVKGGALTSLNIQNGNNTNLTSFTTIPSLNLTCIQVDDVAFMNTNWSTSIESTASFSLDCATLSIEDNVLLGFNIYPNPVKHQFTIQLEDNIELKNINIYNNLGQLVKQNKTLITDVSSLNKGLYIIEIETNQGKATKKLVIE